MKIYLMRHGQTTGDLEDRYGGDYDDDLTKEGRSQAKLLASKIKDYKIEKIFHSPLKRATQTAKILYQKFGVDTEGIKELRERNAYGILTGMIKKEAKEKYPDEVELLKDPHNTIKGAELYSDFKKRILETIEDLAKKDFQTIGIITHGGPIYCFFREVVGQELSKLGDCAIIELDYSNGEYSLIKMNGASF